MNIKTESSIKSLPVGQHKVDGVNNLYLWVSVNRKVTNRVFRQRITQPKVSWVKLDAWDPSGRAGLTLAQAKMVALGNLGNSGQSLSTPTLTSTNSFEFWLKKWEAHFKGEVSPSHHAKTMRQFYLHLPRQWLNTPINEMNHKMIMAPILKLAEDKANASYKLFQWVRVVFALAVDAGELPVNPLPPATPNILRKGRSVKERHPHIKFDLDNHGKEFLEFLNRTQELDTASQIKAAFMTLALTGLRISNVVEMRRDWWDGEYLTVPRAEIKEKVGRTDDWKIKAGTLLKKTLNKALERSKTSKPDSPYMFLPRNYVASKSGHLSPEAVELATKRALLPNQKAVPHGFRPTLRTWCQDSGQDYMAAESLLDHALPKILFHYVRSDFSKQRNVIVGNWDKTIRDGLAKIN